MNIFVFLWARLNIYTYIYIYIYNHNPLPLPPIPNSPAQQNNEKTQILEPILNHTQKDPHRISIH